MAFGFAESCATWPGRVSFHPESTALTFEEILGGLRVSKVISTLIGMISSYKFSYHTYYPSY